jgi:hypothetical protein
MPLLASPLILFIYSHKTRVQLPASPSTHRTERARFPSWDDADRDAPVAPRGAERGRYALIEGRDIEGIGLAGASRPASIRDSAAPFGLTGPDLEDLRA